MKNILSVKSNVGFTLVELLVTITVLGIVTAFAVPNFQRSIRDAKMRNSANQLKIFFYAAKSRSTLKKIKDVKPKNGSNYRSWSFISKTNGDIVKKISIDDGVTVTVSTGSVPATGVEFDMLGQLVQPSASNLAFTVCIAGSGIQSYITTVEQSGSIEVTRGNICS